MISMENDFMPYSFNRPVQSIHEAGIIILIEMIHHTLPFSEKKKGQDGSIFFFHLLMSYLMDNGSKRKI